VPLSATKYQVACRGIGGDSQFERFAHDRDGWNSLIRLEAVRMAKTERAVPDHLSAASSAIGFDEHESPRRQRNLDTSPVGFVHLAGGWPK